MLAIFRAFQTQLLIIVGVTLAGCWVLAVLVFLVAYLTRGKRPQDKRDPDN